MILKPGKFTWPPRGGRLVPNAGHWEFNAGSGNTVFDYSGRRYHATISGLVWGSSRYGPKLSTTSDSQYILADPRARTMLPKDGADYTTSDVSVMLLFRPVVEFNNYSEYGLAKQISSGLASFAFMGSSGGGVFYITDVSGSTQVNSPECGVNLLDGNLHMLVGTYDHKYVRLYCDGVEQGTGTAHTGNIEYADGATWSDFVIANFSAGGDFCAEGHYVAAAVWSWSLCASEIAQLYRMMLLGTPLIFEDAG